MPRSTWRLLAPMTLACTLAAGGGPAAAQTGAPTPCLATLYTDPAGDATYFDPTSPPGFESPGNPNEDLRALFFNYAPGADGKPVLTANIVVESLDKTESGAPYATASSWEMTFGGPEGDTYYLTAKTDGSAWSFEYHYFDRVGTGQAVDPGTLVTEETTGSAFEGAKGVLSIVIPATLPGLKEGADLAGVDVSTTPRDSIQQGSFFTDRMPAASADDKPYKVTSCPAAPADGGTTPPPADGTQPPPGQQPPSQQPPSQQPPSQQPSGPPAPGSPLPASGPLVVDAAADKGKRSTARKRGLRVRVRCSVQCNATAVARIDKKTARKLRLGKKALTFGTGRASITKAGRIPFYVKLSKKAKKALARRGVKKFKVRITITVTDKQGGQRKTVTKTVTLR